jgi:hypothetical protein
MIMWRPHLVWDRHARKITSYNWSISGAPLEHFNGRAAAAAGHSAPAEG